MLNRSISRFVILAAAKRHWEAKDLESIKQRRGFCHALVMICCLAVLLGTIFYTQEPYRYIASTVSFKECLHYQSLLDEEDLDLDHVWEWFDSIVEELGGESSRSVELNCGYDTKNSQKVNIDGVDYYLVSPVNDESACTDTGYIDGSGDFVYLTGVHQVLSFGAFSTRSRKDFPVFGATISSQLDTVEVINSAESSVQPSTDARVVSMCLVKGLNNTFCVSKDGFRDYPGSSLGWKGSTVTQDGNSYCTFENSSSAEIFVSSLKKFTSVSPCYTTTDNGDVIPGVSSYSGPLDDMTQNCGLSWLTSGNSARDNCLDALGNQATALQAYLAGINNKSTVSEVYDYFFGCNTLLSTSESEIRDYHLEQYRPIDTYLTTEQAYGSFFPTSSLKDWVKDSFQFSTELQMANMLDERTRSFIVYFLTRNLNEGGLFYSLIKVKFTMSIEGSISVDLGVTYSPIIDFSYGTNHYAWLFKDAVVWECITLLLYVIFTTRECYQLFQYIRKKHQENSIVPESPLDSPDKMTTVVATPNHRSMPLLQIESDKSGEQQESVRMSQESSGFCDFNQNNIDDFEEIEKLLEDTIPDKNCFMNILDWITIATLLCLMVLRYVYIRKSRALHQLLLDLTGEHTFSARLTDVVTSFHELSSYQSVQTVLLMLVMFVGLAQFFRYLSFDSRFGIVAETIIDSAKDLLHVLFIFIVVLLGYAVLGTSLFGHEIESWDSVGDSMLNLVIFIVGEYGAYLEIFDVQPSVSAIYFWSYMVVAYFIIFNMILAVIFNVYNKKTEAMEARSFAASRKTV